MSEPDVFLTIGLMIGLTFGILIGLVIAQKENRKQPKKRLRPVSVIEIMKELERRGYSARVFKDVAAVPGDPYDCQLYTNVTE